MTRLDIYVTSGCAGCARAREIANSLDAELPDVRVEVIDLETLGREELPEAVVAVPAYVLDGAVISLGNPRLSTLRDRLMRGTGGAAGE